LKSAALAERVRNTAGYTTAMGDDLGIALPASVTPLGDSTFTATGLPNSETRLNWVKASSDGVLVKSQRAGEVTWALHGIDRSWPYGDGRQPLVAGSPEVRRYRIRYLSGDDPVGNYSATVSGTKVP
jgi:hypothetical protein